MIALGMCVFLKSSSLGSNRLSHEKRDSIKQLSNKEDFFCVCSIVKAQCDFKCLLEERNQRTKCHLDPESFIVSKLKDL